MKMTLIPRIKWILSLSLTLAAISLIWCCNAFAKSRRAEAQIPNNVVPFLATDEDLDYRPSSANENGPENDEVRREYLNRIFGTYPPGMSPAAYAEALAAARAVPPSPLLLEGSFVPAQLGGPSTPKIPTPWTFPALYPIATPPPVTACSAWIHALAAHPTDSNTVYAGGWGGLAKSTSDGGTTWQYVRHVGNAGNQLDRHRSDRTRLPSMLVRARTMALPASVSTVPLMQERTGLSWAARPNFKGRS